MSNGGRRESDDADDAFGNSHTLVAITSANVVRPNERTNDDERRWHTPHSDLVYINLAYRRIVRPTINTSSVVRPINKPAATRRTAHGTHARTNTHTNTYKHTRVTRVIAHAVCVLALAALAAAQAANRYRPVMCQPLRSAPLPRPCASLSFCFRPRSVRKMRTRAMRNIFRTKLMMIRAPHTNTYTYSSNPFRSFGGGLHCGRRVHTHIHTHLGWRCDAIEKNSYVCVCVWGGIRGMRKMRLRTCAMCTRDAPPTIVHIFRAAMYACKYCGIRTYICAVRTLLRICREIVGSLGLRACSNLWAVQFECCVCLYFCAVSVCLLRCGC